MNEAKSLRSTPLVLRTSSKTPCSVSSRRLALRVSDSSTTGIAAPDVICNGRSLVTTNATSDGALCDAAIRRKQSSRNRRRTKAIRSAARASCSTLRLEVSTVKKACVAVDFRFENNQERGRTLNSPNAVRVIHRTSQQRLHVFQTATK